ncbi:MAG: TrkA family potassium uptake protein [Spirochaetales bacterium]|nr:TrkA family potassium uptake protein [Spirochaetales bacterium]
MIFKKNKMEKKTAMVVGCSNLGVRVASELSINQWNVVVLDINRNAFQKLPRYYGGETHISNATNLERLEEAGIKDIGLFIVATDSDEVNIASAQIAKVLYDVKNVVARIRDQEKSKLLEDLGIKIICPPSLSIQEINEYIGGKDE